MKKIEELRGQPLDKIQEGYFCYDKEVKEHERDCNCNNTNNLCDIGGSCISRQQ